MRTQQVSVPKTFLDLAERMREAQEAVQDWRATNLLAKQELADKLEKKFDAALRRIKKEQGDRP